MPEKKTVLIADDSAVSRNILASLLENEYEILQAEDGKETLRCIREQRQSISCVLLDLVMPVMDGYECLAAMRESGEINVLPVIVVTESGDLESEKRALREGAWDFISKPFDPEIICFRIKNAILRSRLASFDKLKYLAEYDVLTGIYNKERFLTSTQTMLDKNRDTAFALVRLDVDRFKLVNAYYGKHEGDRLLKYIGDEVEKFALGNGPCTYGHAEGDVFVICMRYSSDIQIQSELEQLLERIKEYNPDYNIAATFGIYVVCTSGETVDRMLDKASIAAKSIKGSYVRIFSFYTESMGRELDIEQGIINDMAQAIEQKQFRVVIQPKYNLSNNMPAGGEALVRWMHPVKGLLMPGEFVPVFERNGLITQMDYYVWNEVCQLQRGWLDKGLKTPPVSVNVSRVNLYNPQLVENICELVERHELPPELLQLEFTESAYTDDPQTMRSVVQRLRERGFTILMDDFGSGYSSLNILKDIDFDILKFDTKFLDSSSNTGRGENIVASVVRMAKWLNMPVIAEGAEKKERAELLRGIGCEYVQGYYFSRPVDPDTYIGIIQQQNITVNENKTTFDASSLWVSSPQMELLFSSALQPTALYEYDDAEQKIERLRVNNAFNELLGYDSMCSPASDAMLLVMPEFRGSIINAVRAALRSRDFAECEYLCRTSGGRKLWINIKIKYISSVGSKHILLGTLTEITTQKEIEHELYRYRSAMADISAHMLKMLVVDDQKTNRNILEQVFSPAFTVICAADGSEALQILKDSGGSFDIILLDMIMPLMDGAEFLRIKKEIKEIMDIPVVVVTVDDSPEQQIRMLEMGASDYIVKPIIPEAAIRRVSNVLESKQRYRAMFREYQSVVDRSSTDQLTNVYNKAAAEKLISELIAKTPMQKHALVVINIDDFTDVNARHGHTKGDVVLMELGRKLTYFFRSGDIVARMGGDEFGVFMMNIHNEENAEKKCEALRRVVSELTIDEGLFAITCSMGVALTRQDISFAALYQNALAALAESKKAGKNRVTIYKTASDAE